MANNTHESSASALTQFVSEGTVSDLALFMRGCGGGEQERVGGGLCSRRRMDMSFSLFLSSDNFLLIIFTAYLHINITTHRTHGLEMKCVCTHRLRLCLRNIDIFVATFTSANDPCTTYSISISSKGKCIVTHNRHTPVQWCSEKCNRSHPEFSHGISRGSL
jgi:hypothetical protein